MLSCLNTKGDAVTDDELKVLLNEWDYRTYQSLGPDDLRWLKLWYTFTENILSSMPVGYEDLFGHDGWKMYIIMREGEEAYRRDYEYDDEEYNEEEEQAV
jgi:hypothetical protein